MTTKYFVPTAVEETKLRSEVMKIMKVHVGQRNAVRGKEIAQALFLADDRKVRVVIAQLIHDGIPIASSVSSEHPGYFIVANGDEKLAYERVLESRIQEDTSRLKDFRRATQNIEAPAQKGLW